MARLLLIHPRMVFAYHVPDIVVGTGNTGVDQKRSLSSWCLPPMADHVPEDVASAHLPILFPQPPPFSPATWDHRVLSEHDG